MKFTTSLSSLFVLLLAQQALATPLNFGSGVAVGGNGASVAPGKAQPSPAKAASSAPAAASSPAKAVAPSKVASASASAAATVKAASSAPPAASASAAPPVASAAAGNSDSDPQTSLTLDPKVIATGFEDDGQDQPTAGQVASLTSSNNFINFCLTVPNLPITNGQQIKTGSCNPAPMGVIAAQTNMPSSKFQNPKNGDVIPANTAFTISMAINHLQTGFFVNANENYFAAPQFTNSAGDVQGHSHVVVELLSSATQTTPTDPTVFAFFKGLNDAAQNGVLTADVTNGLPAGTYRLSSINTAANHQPVLVAVAQHGSLDDQVYFTVSDSGNSTSSASASASAASASASVAIKGANTGGKPGVQGGFANQNQNQNKGQQSNNKGQQNSQQKGQQANQQPNKNQHGNQNLAQPPRGGFGGFGGFKIRRNALNRM